MHAGFSNAAHVAAGSDVAVHDVLMLMLVRLRQLLCGWLQGAPETTRLHFVELAAPPNKQSRAGRKGSLAQAQALSKAYSSLTGVMLALKQQRKQDQHNSRWTC